MQYPTQEEKEKFESALQVLKDQQEEKIKAFLAGKNIEEKYHQGLNNIKNNHKKLFILFHLDGCYGCTVMNYIIKYNKEIADELEKNYEVLLAEMSNVQSYLIDKYSLYSFPTYIVLDKNENIIKQNYGCYLHGHGVEYNFLHWLMSDAGSPE